MRENSCVILKTEGPVLTITLNRPDALNAFNDEQYDGAGDALTNAATDDSIAIAIITGAGRAFCAGLDLKEVTSDEPMGPVVGMRVQRRVSEIVIKMRRAPQPIISLLNGAASGGGFSMALASDIRIAAPNLKMNAAYIRIGLTACDVGASYFLPRLVGASLASELLLTGEFINAERAASSGLVSKVVPLEELLSAGEAMAENILRNSPMGVRLTKECLNMSIDAGSLEAVIAMEDRQQILTAQTGDMKEGIRAFMGKRAPVYKDA